MYIYIYDDKPRTIYKDELFFIFIMITNLNSRTTIVLYLSANILVRDRFCRGLLTETYTVDHRRLRKRLRSFRRLESKLDMYAITFF